MLVLVRFQEIPGVSEAVEALLKEAEKKEAKMPSTAKCKEVVALVLSDCNEMGEESKIPCRSRDGMFFSGIYTVETGCCLFAYNEKTTFKNIITALSA